jgi:hypothetical protein
MSRKTFKQNVNNSKVNNSKVWNVKTYVQSYIMIHDSKYFYHIEFFDVLLFFTQTNLINPFLFCDKLGAPSYLYKYSLSLAFVLYR